MSSAWIWWTLLRPETPQGSPPSWGRLWCGNISVPALPGPARPCRKSFRGARIKHSRKSDAFSRSRTGLAAFEASRLFRGDEIPRELARTHTEMGGPALDYAAAAGSTAVPILAAHAHPVGIGIAEAGARLTGLAVPALTEQGPLTGCWSPYTWPMSPRQQNLAKAGSCGRFAMCLAPTAPFP